jgi:heme/copper-type cytochrome/quinol oxidase subunit 2
MDPMSFHVVQVSLIFERYYLILSSGVSESGNMESMNRQTISKRQNWRGILIAAFLLIILVVFVLFMVYFICRRCINPSVPLNNSERKNYATIFNFRMFFSSSIIYQRIGFCFFV